MGMFDRFYTAGDDFEYQSKAFGQGLVSYHPGHRVHACLSPSLTEESMEAMFAGTFDSDNGLRTGTYQAETFDDCGGCYLNVVDGVYTGVASDRNPTVPLVDYYGRVVGDRPAPPARTEDTNHDPGGAAGR